MTLVPSEAAEQAAVFAWRDALAFRFPALQLLYASPQGALYRRAHGRPHVAGLAPGLPDLHLPVARGGFHGLWIEMKRRRGGRLSEEQRLWAARLRAEGHAVECCKGADAAIAVLYAYVAGEGERRDAESKPGGAHHGARAAAGRHGGADPGVRNAAAGAAQKGTSGDVQ